MEEQLIMIAYYLRQTADELEAYMDGDDYYPAHIRMYCRQLEAIAEKMED